MEPAAGLAAQLIQLPDRTTYLAAASELLLKMFPSDSVAQISMNPEASTADARTYSMNQSGDVPEGWHDFWDDHPILLSCLNDTALGMWRPRRLSDLVTDQELYATRTYQIGLRVLGSNRQLSFLTVRQGRANVQGWSLNRSKHDFTDAEVALSAHIQPILRLLDIAYDDHGQETPENDAAASYSLTAREHEVMHLVGQGLTAMAIGHMLGISPRTICKHLEHAYVKLGCNNRVDALRRFNGR